MYHNFCIHLSVDGHLGCVHVLVIVNSATMNTGVHVSLLGMVYSGHGNITICEIVSGNLLCDAGSSTQCSVTI